MGEIGTKIRNDYMHYATSVLGDWSRIKLSPSEESLTINAKDITLNVDSDTNPFVGGTTSIPINIDKFDMDWIEKTFLNKSVYKKEDKKMSDIKLLEIYRQRAKGKIDDDYVTERYKILKEDTIQNIIEEMENQVNAILESEESKDRLYIRRDYNVSIVTKETQEKLNKLDKDTKLKNENLSNTLGEIYAMFELTENYEERMKILKKYGIINKDGKLGA